MAVTKLKDLGVSTRQGDRLYQEDRFLVAEPGALSVEELALYAIFDGHGGSTVSDHVRRHFIRNLDAQLAREPSQTYAAALRDALKSEDGALRKVSPADQGSTVAIGLLNLKHGLLVVANLGDSHVVLAEKLSSRYEARTHSSRWNITRLSKTHKPSGRTERQRIHNAGGKVNVLRHEPRIGAVNMSRALGDHDLKQPLAGAISEDFIRDDDEITGDLISSEAHTSTHHLHTGLSLLLIASDGIGEEDQAEKAAALAAEQWESGLSAQEIASKMTQSASSHKDSDNCTIIIVGMNSATEPEGR